MARHRLPHDLLENFQVGMDRMIDEWGPYQKGPIINLGAGKKMISNTEALDLPHWRAGDRMPYDDETVGGIIAYHFFEHLKKEEIIEVLWECERVLMFSAPINIVIPHWDTEAAHQDLDHKSFWSESTWRNLFLNPYYEGSMPRDWHLKEVCTVIMGLVQRNLVIVSQLVKE